MREILDALSIVGQAIFIIGGTVACISAALLALGLILSIPVWIWEWWNE